MLLIEIDSGAPLGTLPDNLSREHVNFTLGRWLNGTVHDVGRRVEEYPTLPPTRRLSMCVNGLREAGRRQERLVELWCIRQPRTHGMQGHLLWVMGQTVRYDGAFIAVCGKGFGHRLM